MFAYISNSVKKIKSEIGTSTKFIKWSVAELYNPNMGAGQKADDAEQFAPEVNTLSPIHRNILMTKQYFEKYLTKGGSLQTSNSYECICTLLE